MAKFARNKDQISRNYEITLKERNELIKSAERYLGYDSLLVWNANINGIIIQLQTNDSQLEDFWRESWFPAPLDHNLRPHGVIYALSDISGTKPGIHYHSETRTGVILNPDSYERVRSLALGIVMDTVEEQKEIHFLRGSLVDVNGEGIVIAGGSNSGRSTHTFLLLQLERARIHSCDWIYIEHLGGEKGRLSTSVSERKFYLKTEISKVNPRLKELFKKCKGDNSFFILDPWWIGGEEKFVDTTRIKLIFFLQPDPADETLAKRLNPDEALSLFINSPQPFFNPHLLVFSEERKELQSAFFGELLQFAACYKINTAKPLFDVQNRIREIVLSREYIADLKRPKEERISVTTLLPSLKMEDIKERIKELADQPNVIRPALAKIRQMAEQYGTRTKFGNYNFVSAVKNRSAALTVYLGSPKVVQPTLNPRQREIIKNLPKTMEEIAQYLQKASFVCVERDMGDNPYFTPHCTLFVSTHRKEMVRLAHMVNQTLFERKEERKGPQEYLIHIPEWQEKDRQILAFPETGITYVLGTDYYGEDKKGFLRMAMWFAKQEGMLGLHAGAKVIKAKDKKTGKIKKYSMIIFGLTATGKTTHSCHDHGLNLKGEGIEIAQDDVVFLREDCSCLGTERGFYLKTEGVNPQIQPLIYNAVTKPGAIFENVMVDYRGDVYFGDETLTGNGRGIMQRDDFGKYKSESVNLPPVSELDGMIIIFITRGNTVVPIASKLTPEQAARAFMLGESIETSGSDPKRAGESVREVGTNPFIVGSEAEEGNRFYEIIKSHPQKIQCYLLNTGGIGEIREETEGGVKIVKQKVTRVEILEMAAIIRGIARGTITWVDEPYFGTQVPERVEGVDMSRFDLNKFYTQEQIDNYLSKLNLERREYLKGFTNLNPAMMSQ